MTDYRVYKQKNTLNEVGLFYKNKKKKHKKSYLLNIKSERFYMTDYRVYKQKNTLNEVG